MQKPAYVIYRGMWDLIDWVFPPVCGGCGQRGDVWCPGCDASTSQIAGPICIRCGQKTNRAGGICSECQNHPPVYHASRAFGQFFGPLRRAIHQLKYKRDLGLGLVFAGMLNRLYVDLDWQIDVVVPVPLSKARKAQRGYNQAAIIAYPFSLIAGLAYSARMVWRIRDTQSQVGLSHLERQINVRDAFQANSRTCNQKSILVIDDVSTTGSTLNACATALLEAGAGRVYGLTVARPDHPQHEHALQGEEFEAALPSNYTPGGTYDT